MIQKEEFKEKRATLNELLSALAIPREIWYGCSQLLIVTLEIARKIVPQHQRQLAVRAKCLTEEIYQ